MGAGDSERSHLRDLSLLPWLAGIILMLSFPPGILTIPLLLINCQLKGTLVRMW